MSVFDDKARNWDKDPKKVDRAVFFAERILDCIKPEKHFTAMELGCGTGLLSFQMKDAFENITLVDNSKGMMDVLAEKIQQHQVNNFTPMCMTLSETDSTNETYDVIYTLLTLHHIVDLQEILTVLYKHLNPGGKLCLIDLVEEDGSFHANHPGFDGHNGFNREILSEQLISIGFSIDHYESSYNLPKETETGTRSYPMFLLIAKK